MKRKNKSNQREIAVALELKPIVMQNGIQRFDELNINIKEAIRLLNKVAIETKDREFEEKLINAIVEVENAYIFLRPAVEAFA